MSNQDCNISADENLVRRYKQDAFSTALIFLFSVLFSALCFYLVWDEIFGPPPDPKKFSRFSTRTLASAPKEFRIFFFAILGSIFTVPGVRSMWKLFVNPSVLIISAAGIEHEKSLGRKKFVSWTEMKDVTFHRGVAHIHGQAGSIDVSLFIHGVGRQEILRDIEQYRPDLVKRSSELKSPLHPPPS